MFIKLTNAAPAFRGKKIVINKSSIVTFHRGEAVRDDFIEEVTYVFVPPHGTWEVEETVEEILELIDTYH